MPVISQYNIVSEGSFQTGLSDALVSSFISPIKSKIIWGIGPVFLIPIATNDYLGNKKFGLGPTGVIINQTGSITFGGLFNHVWSIAGDEDRADINQSYINPVFTYNDKSGAGLTMALEYTYDWTNKVSIGAVIPVVSGVTKIGNLPMSIGFAPRMNFFSDKRPTYGIRGVFTFVIPK